MKAGRIRAVSVRTPEGLSGELAHETKYAFAYADTARHNQSRAISLTMPVRTASYDSGALHPIFQMNLPEGYLRRFLAERLMRERLRVNDMLLLAIQGQHGVGRLSYDSGIRMKHDQVDSLEEILHWKGPSSLFSELAQRHLLNTTLSGVQPKVIVNQTVQIDRKTTLVRPELIVKTGGEEFPNLAFNEFVCMSIARESSLPVPEFWLSDDHQLFVCRRFDYQGEKRHGMEDFLTLMGHTESERQARPARYQGSYEVAGKVLELYGCDGEKQRFFEYVALACLLGNGDAHLKNFALMYTDTGTAPWLSPLYDQVCTTVYMGQQAGMALKIGKERSFPTRTRLLQFGKSLGLSIASVSQSIERLSDKAADFVQRFTQWDRFPALKEHLETNLSHAAALKQGMIGYRSSLSREKKRKYPSKH